MGTEQPDRYRSETTTPSLANLSTANILRQHADVLDCSGLREAIERRVGAERRDEVHVDGGVSEVRYRCVQSQKREENFESGDVAGAQPRKRHHSAVSRS